MKLQEGEESQSISTALSHTDSSLNALHTHFHLSTNMDPSTNPIIIILQKPSHTFNQIRIMFRVHEKFTSKSSAMH